MCTSHVTGLQEALTPAIALSSWATNNIATGWNKNRSARAKQQMLPLALHNKNKKQQQAASAHSKHACIRNKTDSLSNRNKITIYLTWNLWGRSQTSKRRDLEKQGCTWMMATTLLWDSCPSEEDTFNIFYCAITELPRLLCALKHMLPKSLFLTGWHLNSTKNTVLEHT